MTKPDKLRTIADGMQRDIDAAFRDRNTNTPKRQREAQSARLEGLRLTRAQAGLRALAGLAEAGQVPAILADVTTRKAAYELARAEIIQRGGYYDAGHESGKPGYDTEAARLFWQLAADAGKAQREAFHLARKIEALRFSNIPGYFPTPPAVVARMLEAAGIEPGALVLEPSAGHGSILDGIKAAHPGARLVAYERHHSLAEIIALKGYTVDRCDFIAQTPEPVYDRVLMNPPFELGQDLEHVKHAFQFLKPGGRLVAIMSPGAFFKTFKAHTEFRAWLETLGATHEDLPADSFKSSGTGVATVLVVIDKPAAQPVAAPRWSADHTRQGTGFAVTLRHGETVVLSKTVRFLSDASRQAQAWLHQAQAGLVPAVPERERISRLAAAPMRLPKAAQAFDLSALPLWSDARHQQDLF